MRRRSILAVVGAPVAVAVIVACSDDRDGFVEPEPDAGQPDSSRPSPDSGAPEDSGSDATDAAVPEERVECAVTPCAIALAARGGAHVCALLADKSVACWGADDKGQLGLGLTDGGEEPHRGARPAKVVGVSGAVQISVVGSGASGTSCARLEDGTVMCWGSNAHGQLSPSAEGVTTDETPHPVPTPVEGLAAAARVEVTGAFACAVSEGSELECWGWNSVLQLGRGYLPKAHGGIAKVSLGTRSVVASSGNLRNAFAISSDGELLSWGASTWDNTGNKPVRDALGRESSLSPDGTPTPIPNLANVSSVSAGEEHACAVANGRAYCWGQNPTGAVGNGSRQDVATPYLVATGSGQPLRDIAVSQRTTCARTVDGAVYCWGDNADGQLGNGKAEPTLSPVYVEKVGGRVIQVVAMDRATCALLKDGSVTCWGSNESGQLGLGERDELPHPMPTRVVF
ncbi:MAG: hypothetical protein K0S65_4697 [Labilithrix sp.]|nr:hypothetical protein [Labilithrix sp.]